MNIRELKEAIEDIPERLWDNSYVIVGEPEKMLIEARIPASGTDVINATLSFDNGGPVLVLEVDE